MEDDIEEMTEKSVDYLVWYNGEETPDIKPGFVYHCITEWYDSKGRLDTFSLIDLTGEDYLYAVEECEKVDIDDFLSRPDWKKYMGLKPKKYKPE